MRTAYKSHFFDLYAYKSFNTTCMRCVFLTLTWTGAIQRTKYICTFRKFHGNGELGELRFNALRVKKISCHFWLLRWDCYYLRQPMEQSEMAADFFRLQSIEAKLTIVLIVRWWFDHCEREPTRARSSAMSTFYCISCIGYRCGNCWYCCGNCARWEWKSTHEKICMRTFVCKPNTKGPPWFVFESHTNQFAYKVQKKCHRNLWSDAS